MVRVELHFNVKTSRSNEGRIPVHEACLQGHTELMRQLVTVYEVELRAKDNENEDVLMYAVKGEHLFI